MVRLGGHPAGEREVGVRRLGGGELFSLDFPGCLVPQQETAVRPEFAAYRDLHPEFEQLRWDVEPLRVGQYADADSGFIYTI